MSPVAQIVADAATKLLITALRGQFASPPLAENVAINNGQGLKAEDRDATGGCDVYGSGGLVGVHTEAMHPGPFVVIGRKGSAGKVTFAPRGGWVTDTAYFATPLRPRELQCKFLFYALKSLDFSADVITTAIPGINRTAIYGYRIPLPPPNLQTPVVEFLDAVTDGKPGRELPQLPSPLAEQRRVVARIEELAAQIHEVRNLRHQATKGAEAIVSRAIWQLLDDGGWTIQPLAELLSESPRNGLAPKQQIEGGRAMLRINAVSSSPTRFVDMTAIKNVEVPDDVAGPFVVQDQDVFIVRYNGDINRVAKPAIYKGANEVRTVYPDKLMRLRPNRAKMTPDFLVFALSSRSVREQIEEIGKTTAGNIGISGANAKSFMVPVPPLPEQGQIVAQLDALQSEVDAVKRLQAETAAELDALLPAILDKAFKGEL